MGLENELRWNKSDRTEKNKIKKKIKLGTRDHTEG